MKNKIYSVTITHFTDDYKHRGDDWSSTQAPILFSSMQKAEDYVISYVLKEIEEKQIDGDWIVKNKLEEYFNDSYEVRLMFRNDLDALETIGNAAFKGEYVMTTLEWQISQVAIDTCVVTLPTYTDAQIAADHAYGEEHDQKENEDDEEEEEEPETKKSKSEEV